MITKLCKCLCCVISNLCPSYTLNHSICCHESVSAWEISCVLSVKNLRDWRVIWILVCVSTSKMFLYFDPERERAAKLTQSVCPFLSLYHEYIIFLFVWDFFLCTSARVCVRTRHLFFFFFSRSTVVVGPLSSGSRTKNKEKNRIHVYPRGRTRELAAESLGVAKRGFCDRGNALSSRWFSPTRSTFWSSFEPR